MGLRRKAREAALQFLFQEDFSSMTPLSAEDLEARFERFCGLYEVSRKARPYTLALLKQTLLNHEEVDSLIRKCAKNWRLERISVADRNLLRIGVCEMRYGEDVPAQVAINECVEIAKRYGGDESPAFINGVLDGVRFILDESSDP